MFETLTSNYIEGISILEKINKLKVVKHFKKSYFTYGFKEFFYFYSTKDDKAVHREEMLKRGWSEIEGQVNMNIYCNFYEQNYIRVPCNAFKINIENNELFSI